MVAAMASAWTASSALPPIAVPAGSAVVAVRGSEGEHAGREHADDAADTVHAEHVEAIVVVEHRLRTVTAQKQMAPTSRPMPSAGPGSTKPAAGVTATRPATAPEIAPRTEGLARSSHSARLHGSVAPAAAICVASTAMPA